MKRLDLAHIVRAASQIADDMRVVILGSQSILATYDEDELPAAVTFSREADVAFWDDIDNEKSDRVDGVIGEQSSFDSVNGYYAQGVSLETAKLPSGWEERLVEFSTHSSQPGTGFGLEIHDLVLSKLAAQREKDFLYAAALWDAGLLDLETLNARVDTMPVPGVIRRRLREWIATRAL